ncbi:MAG: sulfur carrier protein ThiS [Terrimicrobiaceae bacterium]
MKAIKILLNGKPHQTSAETISALAEQLSPAPQTLLIEHNQIALHRSEWGKAALQAGDRVEVLQVSAGG